ncbi:MAG: Asp-tRNA(Asn)/Glu-tRNA(Gln) amidotransferase subunit GatA [Proteobacteria bacterium]|nr:Asp-tRNA(Asn)/Glu-tRNA(Gln) amidotransferase subunit GatA [Pseudomonadota bacterium]
MDILKDWKEVLRAPEQKESYSKYVLNWEEKIHSMLEFDIQRTIKTSVTEGPLAGVPFAVKDNIAVKDFSCTCGSKILENLVSPYSATVIHRLQQAGAVVVAKTNMDEFGMGSSTDDSALARTSNPWDAERVAGGSSGGSAAAVAAGLVPFALGSDTGGSVRQPASFCGVYGLKPTYGALSRYGLVAYASSLDVIGICARDARTTEIVFDLAKGIDTMDHSSIDSPSDKETKVPKKIGVLSNLSDMDPIVERAYQETLVMLRDLSFKVYEIDLPTLEYVVPAYYTIATAEASSNLARYNGIRYGLAAEEPSYEDLVIKSRTEGFGDEVKLRILLGTYVLRSGFQDQYYIRAQKVRTAIRNEFARVFNDVDLIIMPVYPTLAFEHGGAGLSKFQQKLADKFTASANLAGIPAIAFPTGVIDGLPVGMQLLGPPLGETSLFSALYVLEKDLPSIAPNGFENPPWS